MAAQIINNADMLPSADNTLDIGSTDYKFAKIFSTTFNDITLTSQAVGFTIAGGTTSKTLTVSLDTSISGTNTGDVTLATNSGLSLTNQVLNMGTPSTITGATTNSVTTNTHTHAITGFQASNLNLTSLAGLNYASASFVKMTGANTFSLDTNTYLTTVTAHNLLSTTHGDTLTDTVVRGDILIGNSTPKWSRLAFPATPTGKVLQATATDVAWSTNPITIGASASVSGTNTGDVTLATNSGLSLTNQVLNIGTPSTITGTTTNSVTTNTHTHAITGLYKVYTVHGSFALTVTTTPTEYIIDHSAMYTDEDGTKLASFLDYSVPSFVDVDNIIMTPMLNGLSGTKCSVLIYSTVSLAYPNQTLTWYRKGLMTY